MWLGSASSDVVRGSYYHKYALFFVASNCFRHANSLSDQGIMSLEIAKKKEETSSFVVVVFFFLKKKRNN